MKNRITGKIGEKYAEFFLTTQGYKTLYTNYYCQFGEIDVIAIDYPHGYSPDYSKSELVFIEVKTKKTSIFGTSIEAVTKNKKRKIIKTVFHFFQNSKIALPKHWRIDLIAIELEKTYKIKTLTHLKNIING